MRKLGNEGIGERGKRGNRGIGNKEIKKPPDSPPDDLVAVYRDIQESKYGTSAVHKRAAKRSF